MLAGTFSTSDGMTLRRHNTSDIPVLAGVTYTASLWCYSTQAKGWRLAVNWLDASLTQIGTTAVTFTTILNAGRRIVITAISPQNASFAHLELKRDDSGSAIIFVDDVMFYEGEFAEDYVDGDQPGCRWQGAAHMSASARQLNPVFAKFRGMVRNIRPGRRGRTPVMRLEATGLHETLARATASLGPLTRKPAYLVMERVCDVLESGEIFLDGAHRVFGDSDLRALVGSGVTYSAVDSAKTAGTDPEEYGGVEGDLVAKLDIDSGTGDRGVQYDLSSRTSNEITYTVALFVATTIGNSAIGRKVKVLAITSGTPDIVHAQQQITLTDQNWQYVALTVRWPTGSANRKLQVVTDESWWNAPGADAAFVLDCRHVAPAKHRLARRGVGWPFGVPLASTDRSRDLEYLDGYQRIGLDVIEELARSAGGWVYEDGLGVLVFETFMSRAQRAIPLVRFSDGFGHADGLPYDDSPEWGEDILAKYGLVRVTSGGGLSLVTTKSQEVWALEPTPLALAASEKRRFTAEHAIEGKQGLIARRALAGILPVGGWGQDASFGNTQTPYALSYGTTSEVVVQAPAGGQTIIRLLIRARIQHRSSEFSFVEKAVANAQPEVLEIDMPAQGDRTPLMKAVASWAAERYGRGPSTMRLSLTPANYEELAVALGIETSTPLSFTNSLGPGHLGIDDVLFWTEGWELDSSASNLPTLTLDCEEA
jgi:hypothetical protein